MKYLMGVTFLCATIFGYVRYKDQSKIPQGCYSTSRDYQEAQSQILAKELVKGYKGNGKCLIIHHPLYSAERKHLNITLSYFQKGLGPNIKIRPAPIKLPATETELADEPLLEMTAKDFNKVIEDNRDCDIIIALVPLPFDEKELYKINIFNSENKHLRFGIYNGYIGNLEPLFKEKYIDCMSIWKPEPIIDERPIPEDHQVAFDLRYLLITPENIQETKNVHPTLFPKIAE
ncbi:MAG: hypothetical protein NE330_09795 [Lentisphaeraceae bacterium]|nr:hypothetical protein [Lentisphaeraceae bacterium]